MTLHYDCVIIGAGVIGSCLAFELAKKGYRTLNLDKGPGAGHGSTGNSCAIIRVHYSLPIRLTHTPTRDRFCVYNG